MRFNSGTTTYEDVATAAGSIHVMDILYLIHHWEASPLISALFIYSHDSVSHQPRVRTWGLDKSGAIEISEDFIDECKQRFDVGWEGDVLEFRKAMSKEMETTSSEPENRQVIDRHFSIW